MYIDTYKHECIYVYIKRDKTNSDPDRKYKKIRQSEGEKN